MKEGKWSFKRVAWYIYGENANPGIVQHLSEISGWKVESITHIMREKLWHDEVEYNEVELNEPTGVDVDRIDNVFYAETSRHLARDGSRIPNAYKTTDDGTSYAIEREDEPQELDFS